MWPCCSQKQWSSALVLWKSNREIELMCCCWLCLSKWVVLSGSWREVHFLGDKNLRFRIIHFQFVSCPNYYLIKWTITDFIRTLVTKIIQEDDFMQVLWGRSVDYTVSSTKQWWPGLIVKNNHHAGCRQLSRVHNVFAPEIKNGSTRNHIKNITTMN